MTSNLPEPQTMTEVAVQLHKYYVSLQAAGFTKQEAMCLLTGRPLEDPEDK